MSIETLEDSPVKNNQKRKTSPEPKRWTNDLTDKKQKNTADQKVDFPKLKMEPEQEKSMTADETIE